MPELSKTEKKPEYTKIFRQHNGEQSACVQIHSNHYSCSLKHILELVTELKKDFPGLWDEDIQIQKYGGPRVKGITFVEAFFNTRITPPSGYKTVKDIEYTL